MQQQKIELAKARDFSEVISDTIAFVRQNFKPLIRCILTFCGIFLVALAVCYTLQQYKTIHLYGEIYSGAATNSFSSPFRAFGWEYFLLIFFAIIYSATMSATVFSYMALYKSKGNEAPAVTEVWAYLKYYFLRLLGANFLILLITIVGVALCIIPGVYLGVVLSIVSPIMVFENTSFGYAFNRAFQLIKGSWWQTFGCIFVTAIIIYFASAIVTVPALIINFVFMLNHAAANQGGLLIFGLAVSGILTQIGQIFYAMLVVAISLCYFNLIETKEGTSLMERIDKLGSLPPTNDSPTEEY